MKLISLIIILLFCFLSSCHSQPSNPDCLSNFNLARERMNAFYQNGDSSELISSIPLLDIALNCNETKIAATESKLGVYSLLGRYNDAIRFIETISSDNFQRPYQIHSFKNFFLAKEHESQARPEEYKSYMEKAVLVVQEFIDNDEKERNPFNLEAYVDKYFYKRFLFPKVVLLQEIDELEERFPNEERISFLRNYVSDETESETSEII